MKEKIIIKEVLRYMNMPYTEADDEIKLQILNTYNELESLAKVRSALSYFELDIKENCIAFKDTSILIASEDLKRLFQNSQGAFLLAVTLGVDVDKKINSVQQRDMLQALLFNACANVMIESACDQIESKIIDQLEEDQYLTMRYSPGYGDVSLEVQGELLTVLDTTRKIGLTATKSGMLIPLKSVTAFIGLSNVKENRAKKCSECLMHETCTYRRRGDRCGS